MSLATSQMQSVEGMAHRSGLAILPHAGCDASHFGPFGEFDFNYCILASLLACTEPTKPDTTCDNCNFVARSKNATRGSWPYS